MLKPISVMPWQMPDPNKPLKMQEKAAFQTHLIDHLASFDIDSPLSPCLLTSIVCTIGPSCIDKTVLGNMLEKGMTVARLDMRIGNLSDNLSKLENIRKAATEHSLKKQRVFPLAIAIDLRGPEILTGKLLRGDKVNIKGGEVLILTSHPAWDDRGTKEKIFVDNKDLPKILKPGDKILIDFGRIELVVRGTVDSDIVCDIIYDCELGNYKNVNIPGVPLDIGTLTEKDKKDVLFALQHNIDAIFVSFVRDRSGIQEVRDLLGEKGKCIMIFAKIENRIAFEHFDEILAFSDGIVINRGAMSIEMSTEKVLQAQRTIIAKCNKIGKPVMCMTEFLNSMIHKPCPTIAEVADVASIIYDGLDALILTDETAVGERPVMTVETLATLCREAEAQVWAKEIFHSLNVAAVPPVDPSQAISIASVEAALKCQAAAIIIVTTSGRSVEVVAKYRPRCPILGITRYSSVARHLNMWRGIIPVLYTAPPQSCWTKDVDLRIQYGIQVGKNLKIIKTGDPLVLVNGWRQGAGFINNLRIVYASSTETYTNPGSNGLGGFPLSVSDVDGNEKVKTS